MSGKLVFHQRMEIKDKKERLAVASILIGNGYTVREGAVKPDGKSVKKYFVEYWKEEN